MVSLPQEDTSVKDVDTAADRDGDISSGGGAPHISSVQCGVMLPVQRIKMIMKSCPDVETVQQESLHTIARATELFIAYLSQEAYKKGSSSRLDYDGLSEMVQGCGKLEFLMETVPKKNYLGRVPETYASETSTHG